MVAWESGYATDGVLGVERADASAAAVVDLHLADVPREIVPHRLEVEQQAAELVDHVLADGMADRHPAVATSVPNRTLLMTGRRSTS
jgi:hypothetical protein